MSSTFFTFYFIFKSTSLKRRFPRFDVVVVSSLLLHSYSMYVVAVKMQSRAKIFEVNELWCRRPPPRRGEGGGGIRGGEGRGHRRRRRLVIMQRLQCMPVVVDRVAFCLHAQHRFTSHPHTASASPDRAGAHSHTHAVVHLLSEGKRFGGFGFSKVCCMLLLLPLLGAPCVCDTLA